MRLAHLADLHLGFRQYGRSTPTGMNQREADVQDGLRQAIDGILAARPELVAIAGDVFHSVRPPNAAILFLFAQLQRIRVALPDTPIVLIAGDHDTPRTADTGFILPLYQALGVQVALIEPLRLVYRDYTVTAVPKACAHQIPPPPALDNAPHILVTHGDFLGVVGSAGREPIGAIDPSAIAPYSYVALGHYHVYQQAAPNAWYSGALDYTSTDPWAESHGAPKGWNLVALGDGYPIEVSRQLVTTRRFVDCTPIDAGGYTAAVIDGLIAERLAGLDGCIVRLKVQNAAPDLRRELDYDALRRHRARLFHLQLEVRRADRVGTPEGRRATFQRLDDRLRAFLEDVELPAGVDRAEFVASGLRYYEDTHAKP